MPFSFLQHKNANSVFVSISIFSGNMVINITKWNTTNTFHIYTVTLLIVLAVAFRTVFIDNTFVALILFPTCCSIHSYNSSAVICFHSRRNLAATFNFRVVGLTHIFLRLLALPIFHLLLWIFYSGMEDYQRTFITRNGLIFNCLAGAYFVSIIITASTCKFVYSFIGQLSIYEKNVI
jgi:hypothetical protein